MLRRLNGPHGQDADPSDNSGSKRRSRFARRRLLYVLMVLVVGFSASGGLVALRVADPFFVSEVRQLAFDMLQRAAPREFVETPTKIIDIDERSLAELGQWPWPRDRLAEMVDRLHAAGAAAIAFDFLFIEPDRASQIVRPRSGTEPDAPDAYPRFADNDQIFAEALQRGNVVLGFGASEEVSGAPPVKAGFAFTGLDPTDFVTPLPGGANVLPTLAEAAAGLGSVNLRKDSSADAVRAIQLLWKIDDQLYPSLVSEALRIAQGASTYVVHANQDIGGIGALRIGGFEVPTGPHGELFVYYTPPRPERYISAVDLFDNDKLSALAPEINGKIIMIGTSATGLFDLHRTPLGHTVPGIEMHAQALEQIITGQFLMREDWTRTVELLALVLACLLVWCITIFGSAGVALLTGAALSAAMGYGAWYAFQDLGVLVDFSFPLGGGMLVWFFATAFRYTVTDREKRGIRSAFSRYVHPSVLKQIEENYSKVELGGENCELTVMFTDVRNFTPLSERLSPSELVLFLNTLLGELSEKIAEEGGVIDKFIGDSVMAFWNAPLRQPTHARQACAAALKMREAIEKMSAEKSFGLPEEIGRSSTIEIGVGINTGTACVGNVGSEQRFNYSAIGDAVNVAARAESACKELAFDLVVCGSTARQVPDFAFLPAGHVELKGKSTRVPMMILIGDETVKSSPQFAELERRHSELIAALKTEDISEIENAVRQCRLLARNFGGPLLRFIDRIPERAVDFHRDAKEFA